MPESDGSRLVLEPAFSRLLGALPCSPEMRNGDKQSKSGAGSGERDIGVDLTRTRRPVQVLL